MDDKLEDNDDGTDNTVSAKFLPTFSAKFAWFQAETAYFAACYVYIQFKTLRSVIATFLQYLMRLKR